MQTIILVLQVIGLVIATMVFGAGVFLVIGKMMIYFSKKNDASKTELGHVFWFMCNITLGALLMFVPLITLIVLTSDG